MSEKALYKLDRGIYSDRPYVPFVEIAAKRYPNAVVTLDSAFYYQGLTDVVPDVLHLATDRKASRIADRRTFRGQSPEKRTPAWVSWLICRGGSANAVRNRRGSFGAVKAVRGDFLDCSIDATRCSCESASA